jgi:membrane protease subunit HflC
MNNRAFVGLLAAGFVALALYLATFTVAQTELAIKFRFGEIIGSGADYEPGLHFMVPFYNNVRKFDRRILTQNTPAEQFLTSEGKILRIDFYVKWRIANVSTYYQATAGGDEDIAAARLNEIVKAGIKDVIARRTIQQVVAAERAEFIGEILKVADTNTRDLGVQLIDVRVKKIDLPDEVTDSVYSRMRQDFARQAAGLRAEGAENSEKLRAEADRQRTEILASSYRDAEIIKGEGDARSAETYGKAYGKNAEFYSFYRSLQAYRESLGGDGDVFVISPDSDFFKYLNKPSAK